MCGIAGLVLRTPIAGLAPLLAELQRDLAHRGPDDLGYLQWRDGAEPRVGREPETMAGCRVALVHRRLSILDPSPLPAQPMSSPDGRYHLVFNGVIYNYVELRRQLEDAGHRFHSSGDTEVLLHALIEWARSSRRFVGMFALALFDVRRRTVLLGRDPLGIKPLYYADMPDGAAFASRASTLLLVPGVRGRQSAAALRLSRSGHRSRRRDFARRHPAGAARHAAGILLRRAPQAGASVSFGSRTWNALARYRSMRRPSG